MTLVATGSGGAGTMLRPTVSRLALFFSLSQFYRNLRQRLTNCRSDQGPAVTKTGGRRGRERAGAAGKGTAREDGRDGQGRAASKNGRDGQGRVRRTRASAASKDKATRAAGGEDRRMGTGWVVARTGGKEKDGQPRRKSPPPAQASVRAADKGSRPTAAVAGASALPTR